MREDGKRYDAVVSVVVPVHNVATEIGPLLSHLHQVMAEWFQHYEIVLVDNGSVDGTVGEIRALQQTVSNTQLYCLNRRNTFDVAVVAGLDNSIGDYVLTLNHQTDPIELLPKLFELSRKGNEVVVGIREDRMNRTVYAWVNKRFVHVMRATAGVNLPPGLSDLRLYSRSVVSYINLNADRHLLLKVLPFLATTRVASMPYRPLRGDQTAEGRSLTGAFFTGSSMLLSSSVAPLRLLTMLTLVTSSLSLLYALYVVVVALVKHNVVEGWVSLALPMAVMFFFISTILGILAEYVFRMAQHTRNRPVYTISDESTSSSLGIQGKLNVVESGGNFAEHKALLRDLK
jgi:glycosyltransferase involved in cell wall biosynthesis